MMQSNYHESLDLVIGVSELFEKFIMSGCILIPFILSKGFIKIIRFDIESILLVPVRTFLSLFDVQIANIIELQDNIIECFGGDIEGSQDVVSGAVEQWYHLQEHVLEQLMVVVFPTYFQYLAEHVHGAVLADVDHLHAAHNLVQLVLFLLNELRVYCILEVVMHILDALADLLQLLDDDVDL